MTALNPVEAQQLREMMSEIPDHPGEDFWAEETVEFENNTQGWKEPHEHPAYYPSLVESFEQMVVEESWLASLRPPLTEGSEEFFDHVKALWAQRARENDPGLPPTENEDFAALPVKERIRAAMYMDEVLRTVFEWMRQTGKDPIPSLTQWPQSLPDHFLAQLED